MTVVESFTSLGSYEFGVTHYDYSNYEDLTWEFTRDTWYNSDDYLVVTFLEGFAVESNYDYVEVYTTSGLFDVIENDADGNIVSTSNSACSCPLPCTFYTEDDSIWVNFKSDSSETDEGFSFIFTTRTALMSSGSSADNIWPCAPSSGGDWFWIALGIISFLGLGYSYSKCKAKCSEAQKSWDERNATFQSNRRRNMNTALRNNGITTVHNNALGGLSILDSGGVDPYAAAMAVTQPKATQATQATRTAGLAKGSALAAQPKAHAHATPESSVEMFAIKKPLMHPIGTVWFCDGCGMQNAMGQLKCPQCQGNRTAFLPINY